MAKDILLVTHNHFDPTWRRCFDRPATYNGVTVRSYAEVEEHCFNRWFKLAPRGYTYSEGQTAILRKYLERNPKAKLRLKDEIAAGHFEINRAGEVVPDTVMSTAEGLVRNFLVAEPLYRELGVDSHPAMKIGWLEDAFGNSPNYPQVLRGVGAEAAAWISYRPCPEPVWVGIDGSKILATDKHPSLFGGSFAKHAPCPACRGKGCSVCKKTGLLFVDGFDIPALRKTLEDAVKRKEPWVAIRFLAEEVLPDPKVADLVDEMNRKLRGRARIRFANPADVYRLIRPKLLAALRKRDDKPSADLNPAMPGCMVSRIKLKQRTRSVAYHLVASEAVLANKSWQNGKPVAPPQAFAKAWQLLAFNQFHDAITGTHIDSAYPELHDMLDQAEAVAKRILPLKLARPDVGTLKTVKTKTAKFKLGQLDVSFDKFGITSIICKGRNLFKVEQPKWNNTSRDLRIGELVLEPDYGDPWGQRIAPAGSHGWENFSIVALGNYHTAVHASDRAIRWTGKYTGGDTKVKKLNWTVTVTVSADGKRLDFATELDWDAGSRRIRAVFPVASKDPTATYEVPFGFIDRTFDNAQLKYGAWETHPMEFPTLHWLCKKIDKRSGVALLNRGLPCYRWMPTRLDISLVRSPEYAFCLVEPASYEFWDVDGMRDPGQHRFEYSIMPYTDGLTPGELTRIGYDYNSPAPIRLPFKVYGDVVVTAWKPAEDGSGWILRLQEAGGKWTKVALHFDKEREVTATNLLEHACGKTVSAKEYQTRLHKHGILTLKIR